MQQGCKINLGNLGYNKERQASTYIKLQH